MSYITRLKHIRRRDNFIIILIIGYNSHYIHFKEVITEISLSYKHTTFRGYKFITLKNHLKLFLLNNKSDTQLFLISVTCNTLLRVWSFLEIIFSMTFLTPSILEVNEFPMWRFSPSISLKVKNILLSMSAYLVAPMSTYHYS